MIAVTGRGTSIVQELGKLTDEHIESMRIDLAYFDARLELPEETSLFVLAAGVLYEKKILEQQPEEIQRSLAVNLVNVVRLCELILETVRDARICIIGSQSGRHGSFDQTYALAKASVHAYVQWRNVLPTQLLVAIAPPIIADSGMTKRRSDYPDVLTRRRTVTAAQVAEQVHRALFDEPTGRHEVQFL